jgi:large subunit ribosomal protein L29
MSKKTKSITDKTVSELSADIASSRAKLLKLNLAKSTKQLENHGELRELRRNIARLETARTLKTK